MPQAVFCPNCGAPIAQQDAFCRRCGQNIAPETAPRPHMPPNDLAGPPVRPRRRARTSLILTAGCTVLIALAAGALLLWPGHLLSGGTASANPPASTATASKTDITARDTVPAGAAATAQRMVSGTAAQQRAALTPQLNAALPAGLLFPAGATVALDESSWHQSGPYANATGKLSVPGQAVRPVEIGFVERSGTWLVTFDESLS
jgi:hypothetical protein